MYFYVIRWGNVLYVREDNQAVDEACDLEAISTEMPGSCIIWGSDYEEEAYEAADCFAEELGVEIGEV